MVPAQEGKLQDIDQPSNVYLTRCCRARCVRRCKEERMFGVRHQWVTCMSEVQLKQSERRARALSNCHPPNRAPAVGARRVMRSCARAAHTQLAVVKLPRSPHSRRTPTIDSHDLSAMEDDAFGAVWGTPDPSPLAPKPLAPIFSSGPSQDGFDDFDEFGTPAETIATSAVDGDDDFGDFGDFGEAQDMGEVPAFEEDAGFGEEVRISGPSTYAPSYAPDWEPLRLRPLPARQELQEQVDHILAPLWSSIDDSQLTDDDIRQTGGLNQTLITQER